MKRGGLIVACFSLILLLTGCGKKELECKKSSETEGNQTINLTFNSKDVLESGKMKMELNVGEQDKETMKTFKDALKKEFASEYEGLEIEVSDNGKDKLIVTMDFDADELSKAMGETISEDSDNYDSIKKQLDDEGYTCK